MAYAKVPFGGPNDFLQYLARYTHRVAISSHRLIAFDGESVTFRSKDCAHGNNKRTRTVSADEFLRPFRRHRQPRGFVPIGSSGFLAGTRRVMLRLARQLLTATYARRRSAAVHSGARVIPAPHLLHTDDRRRTALTSYTEHGEALNDSS